MARTDGVQRNKTALLIVGGIAVLILILCGSCVASIGGSDKAAPLAGTVTSTVVVTVTETSTPTSTSESSGETDAPETSGIGDDDDADDDSRTRGLIPPPADRTTPTDRTTPAPATTTDSGGSAYYSSCKAARAAGVAPLRRGEPGYRSGLDRDGDGIACDS